MSAVHLIIDREDLALREQIRDLLAPDHDPHWYTVGGGATDTLLGALLPLAPVPLVVVVTDRLLTNPNLVAGLPDRLAALPEVVPLTADLRGPLDSNDLRFHYLDRWQRRYLELRGESAHYAADALANFQQYLQRVRQSSLDFEPLLDCLVGREPLALTSVREDSKQLTDRLGTTPPTRPAPAPKSVTPPAAGERSAAELTVQAWELSDAGDEASALSLLSTAAGRPGAAPDLRFQYALMLALVHQDTAAARSVLDELLQDHPYHHDGLFLSGELYAAKENFAGARVQWDKLGDLNPGYPKLDERLAVLVAERFPDNHSEAVVHFKRALATGTVETATRIAYARLLANRLGRAKKARKVLRRAVKNDRKSGPAHYHLAVAEYAAGHVTAARQNYLLAIHLEPTYDTHDNRAAFFTEPTAVAGAERTEVKTLRKRVAKLERKLSARPGDHLRGLTVLVSGTTSGIGRATARSLAAAGCRILALGRRGERLDELGRELTDRHGTEYHRLELDVRNRRAVAEAITRLPDDWAAIDVLVNNAGKAKGFDPIHTGDLDHWDEMIDVNLRGLLYLTRAVTPGMVERGSGTVINVASTAGKEVYPNGNVYCATKHAVDALTYAMRLDLVKHGIRVGQICPAHVEETEFAVVRFDGDRERAKIYQDFQPLRSSDVAEAIRFMLDRPPHVNIMDVVLQGTQQASSTVVDRSGRAKFAPTDD